MFKQLIFLLILSGICSQDIIGQEIQVHGNFMEDSVRIGEDIPYSLTARYPDYYEIIFPDSSFGYQPFEYVSRKYFPTRTDSTSSFDSVIYYLRTFEIDSVQYLQLPVFLKQVDDSATIYTARDSVMLDYVIKEKPDSLALKENTSLFHVPGIFNYPVLLIILAGVFVLIILIILIFGRKIVRWYRLYRMKRRHRKFLEKFYNELRGLRDGRAGAEPEIVLSEWKKYMEKIEKEPYTKLTSKELINLHADHRLKDNLRSIDRYIYGSVKDRPLYENFEKLLEYSIERYELRIEEVRNE